MKKSILFFASLLFILSFQVLRAQENPVNADIVVAADGTGDFTSLQAAINAVPSNSDRRTVIYIKRGLYNTEKLIVPGDKINVSLIGESREETILSYHMYDCTSGKCPAEDAALWTGDNILTSATLTILGDGFRAENLTIQNTAGPVGQAQAITVRADKCVFIGVNLSGYQDTIYFWSNAKRSYFQDCLVVGRTDYIYGSGTAFFQGCEIRSWGGGWITAPSTALDQPYGFVFNECNISYALNSPRGGDDGGLVRLGRPWHNYPKVAWLNCEMTEEIHPQGWGDTWNMNYAATSTDLHLYEYKNTGPGADMSGRASWAGLRALSDAEALNYSVQKVMAGTDGWDPTAEAPLVQKYTWTGNGASNGWLVPQNWNPAGTPATGESAEVSGATITADGGTFSADLILMDMATLMVGESVTATYISMDGAQIATSANATLSGRIATKDSLLFTNDHNLTVDAQISGVHRLIMKGLGEVVLNASNAGFSGAVEIESGILNAAFENALGKGPVELKSGATLKIGISSAMYAKSSLNVVTGSALILNADVTISEFFIDGNLQSVGEYSAATHGSIISGSGKIIVGRPDVFTFHRGANGNWDNPVHFIPALFPLTGETVICEEEMETTSTVFEADIVLRNGGGLRLRGDASKNHQSTGTIFLETGTQFKYNTGGTGMYIHAPIVAQGDAIMIMESDNPAGSSMTLAGPVSGSSTITALNNGKNNPNRGTLVLSGDNSNFNGTWDLTLYSTKYPAVSGYVSAIEGVSENAFGKGKIIASHANRVVFSHPKAVGDSLVLTLDESAKVVLNTDVTVKKMVLNGTPVEKGSYSISTNPELYEGSGNLIVGESGDDPVITKLPAFPGAEGHGKYVTGGRGGQVIYVTNLEDNTSPGSLRYAINQQGPRIIVFKVSGYIKLKSRLNITKGDVTIAGQTAPGDGITLRDYPVVVDADNVIIRFLRFRMGDVTNQEADAIGGRYHKNIIVDHCSMSWSTDECVSFYHNENFTLQWCVISESLRNSVHDKGSHGYGGIWGGKNASFHHNLLAHHDSRNPRLGETKGDAFAFTDLVDLRNNVIYNWQGNSCYGGEAMNVNIVNCYYKPGPATTKSERIISIDKLTEPGYAISDIWGKFYINGNVLTASARASNDNWTYGVFNQFNSKYTVTTADKTAMRLNTPLSPGEVTTHSAEKAYEKILLFGGASLKRDSVDLRIMHDVSTGTATYMNGGNGSTKGFVDTQNAVGGWPVLQSLPAPTDTDNDGMPDAWETANGLSLNDPTDAQLKTVDGLYPNIEVYINSLVQPIITEQNKEGVQTTMEKPVADHSNPEIYFNSNTRILHVSHVVSVEKIHIYTLTGRQIVNRRFGSTEITLPLEEIGMGIYIVRAFTDGGELAAKKISVF